MEFEEKPHNYKAIKLNRIRLDLCHQHRFENTNGAVITCVRCKGVLTRKEALQYVKGFMSATDNANIVWAGFEKKGKQLKTHCPKCTLTKPFDDCPLCKGTLFAPLSKASIYFNECEETLENVEE